MLSVRNVSKKYTLASEKRYVKKSIKDDLLSFFTKKGKKESIWALRDVTFEAKEGEIIGVLGKNGSGKSTLLKVLAGITFPTTGEVRLHGKVNSLMDIDIGFHPELTGKENIYLNGILLGFTKKEIEKEFDNIVTFSGIKRFIDIPIKHYSSGMYVRLAFAVATAPRMEPNILLIDEVFAVGDIDFQKKSFDRIKELTQDSHTTVLFVSHNLRAIEKLCSRCLWLSKGKLQMLGEAGKVIQAYVKAATDTSL